MSKFLKALIQPFAHIYVFIDALDEFAKLDDLKGFINDIHQWSYPQLHIFLTSQPHDTAITKGLIQLVDPQDHVDLGSSRIQGDIRCYIREYLKDLSLLLGARELLTHIENVITSSADGSYAHHIIDVSISSLSSF
jgi:hypothetical protein